MRVPTLGRERTWDLRITRVWPGNTSSHRPRTRASHGLHYDGGPPSSQRAPRTRARRSHRSRTSCRGPRASARTRTGFPAGRWTPTPHQVVPHFRNGTIDSWRRFHCRRRRLLLRKRAFDGVTGLSASREAAFENGPALYTISGRISVPGLEIRPTPGGRRPGPVEATHPRWRQLVSQPASGLRLGCGR